MKTHIRNGDLDTTWNIASSKDTWILAKSADITTTTETAIFQGAGFSGDTIIIKGNVSVGNPLKAIELKGDDTKLIVSSDSTVSAASSNVSLYSDGANFELENSGKMFGKLSGVYVVDGATVTNAGTIKAQDAIYAAEGNVEVFNSGKIIGSDTGIDTIAANSKIVNMEGGKISGGDFGIELRNEGNGVIKNFGTISGDVAISDMGGNSKIINSGVINGVVQLGDGQDTFDSRKGSLIGTVDGGNDADTYLIGDANIKIAEQLYHGMDTVKTTVTYTLESNLENLRLLGKNDIDGSGNSGNNGIAGNNGDNVLKGLGGSDNFSSDLGNDVMIGGKGADLFEFNHTTGNDTIADFQNGKDVILSDFVTTEEQFQDLVDNHLTVQGDDLLIKYDGDSLRLEDMAKADLDSSDFLMGL